MQPKATMPSWPTSYGSRMFTSGAGVRAELVLREARDLDEGAEEGKGVAIGAVSRRGGASDLLSLVSTGATTKGTWLANGLPCSVCRKSKDLVALAEKGVGLEGVGQSKARGTP